MTYKEKEITEFIDFIDSTPNSYWCTEHLRNKLLEQGYRELTFNGIWEYDCIGGKFFITKNNSSLIAFTIPKNKSDIVGFNITSTHNDSPSFNIKTNPEIYSEGYLKLNVDGYGGMINYSWLDRPLSIAGRVIVKDKNQYKAINVNIDKDLLVIPSQAIHINREVNTKNELNKQKDMLPIISLTNDLKVKDIIETYLKDNNYQYDSVCDYDLYLYNRDKSKIMGLNNEFILAPRLDDLACVWPAYKSFITANNDLSINVLSVFNNEEIGSLTSQGADSTFLSDVLNRIAKLVNKDVITLLNNSMVISADNAHAIHPNATEKSDPTNKVYLNKGVVIKHHTNYTTDALTSSIFKGICDNGNINYQDFASKSDMRCGSTLGGISQSQVSIDSIDIGIPQLAMHSANELIGTDDLISMYYAMLEFYNTTICKEKNSVKVLSNKKKWL